MRSVSVRLLLVFFILFATPVSAHRFAPSILKVSQVGLNEFNIVWKTPAQGVSGTPLRPLWPSSCNINSQSPPQLEGTGVVSQWQVACKFGKDGIVGQKLSVDGLAANQASAILIISLLDDRAYQTVLDSDSSSFIVPREPDVGEIIISYPLLGAQHILEGIDHLLFVFGLLLLVGGGSRLFWTITAFTLGHSVTLALVTLEIVVFPSDLAELVIALSIFLLALELSQKENPGFLWKNPWWLAGGFGLLHGMGFAGALAETGLPQNQVPLALLFFNLGIEIGQLLFIATVYLVWFFSRSIVPDNFLVRKIPVYILGGLSAMWCIQRGMEVVY